MMTISDYVQALQVCRKQGVSMLDLSTRTITGEKGRDRMREEERRRKRGREKRRQRGRGERRRQRG